MSARVTGLQPFTLVSGHSCHARNWSHHGINGVDCTVPRSPTNRQYGPIRPRPAVSAHFLHIPPPRPAPSCCLRGLVFRVLRPNQYSHLSSSEPPATSWIFSVRHPYPALVSITPSVNLCIHYVVHLVQDRFLCRSSGRLVVGKVAKGVAPVPSSETKCYAPTEQCGVAQYLGRERRGSPKKRLHNRTTKRTKCPWRHCQGVGPLQHN